MILETASSVPIPPEVLVGIRLALRHCLRLLGVRLERTLDQYERDPRLVCFATATGVEGVTHGDLMLVARGGNGLDSGVSRLNLT
jgi:hypothetical protein